MKHFDFIAPFYDRFFGNYQPVDRWIELLALPVNGILLDAAGGTGRVTQQLIDQVESVLVVDQSFGMLRQVANDCNFLAVQSNTEKLPFEDNSVDRVIMVDAFHHIVQQQKAANELWRVLKLGGVLLIEEPDIHTLGVKFVALVEKILLMPSHFVSSENIAAMFVRLASSVKIYKEGGIAWIQVIKAPR